MLVFALFSFFVSPAEIFSQEVEPDIEKGFLTTDPELIIRHFDTDVKVIILQDSYHPGKQEAIKILNDFFRDHQVEGFESRFDSEKTNSNFMIKILKTRNESFRVTIFFIKSGESVKINLLRIEQEHESEF